MGNIYKKYGNAFPFNKMRIIYIVTIFGFMAGCGSTEVKVAHTTTLYTDLVDIIGRNNSCAANTHENISKHENLFTKQGIVISNYEFHDVNLLNAEIGKCDVVDVRSQRYAENRWACFATDTSTSREPNWFFVDCRKSKIISVKCLDNIEIPDVTENLCEGKVENKTCHDFSYGNARKYAVCSKHFRLKTSIRTKTVTPASYTELEDIIAYLCIAFILVTFVLAVVIPAEKCKPTYKYDKEQGLRVPLEIYEMYGVSYQPSAKKKHNRKSVNMNVIPAIASHTSNVAAIANNPVIWKGYKTKFNFQHNQPLFQAMIRGFGEDGEGNSNRNERLIEGSSDNNGFENKRNSCAGSIGSVGTFDYTLFHNQLEQGSEQIASVTFSDEEQNYSGENVTQEHRKGLKELITLVGHEQGKHNEGFVPGLEDGYAKVNGNTTCIKSGQEERQSSLPSGEIKHVQFSCQNRPIHYNDENEEINANDDYSKDNITTENLEDDHSGIIDKDDGEFDSDDIEQYDKDRNILLPIYEDLKEHTECTCKNRSETVCSDSSSIVPNSDEDIVRVKTFSEYPASKSKDMERSSTIKYMEHADVDDSKEAQRPRISITVEFPKNFGIKSGTKIEHIHDQTDEEKHKWNKKRSLSAKQVSTKINSSNSSRKYSLC